LQNTGLRRLIDAFNSNELKKIQEAGIEVPQWASPEDIQRIGDAVWPGQYGKAPGMASGGPAPATNWDIFNEVPRNFAQGGQVTPNPAPSSWDIFAQ
jgi:hypothetical protein